jgi:hypothetical protein
MSENVSSTVLRAQERLREAILVLQGGLDDPSLLDVSLRRALKILETQEQLLAGVE